MTAPILTQTDFRGRNDDGSESAATWKDIANNDWTQAVDTIFRCRLVMAESNDRDANNITYELRSSYNSGPYNLVHTASSNIKLIGSANTTWTLTDGDSTSQQIGSGTYTNGTWEDAGNTGAFTLPGLNETEFEWCLAIVSEDVSDSDTIELQLYRLGGTAMNGGYDNTPTITVSKAAPSITTVNIDKRIMRGSGRGIMRGT